VNEQKGQVLLVEAGAVRARRGVDCELVLVGDGEMRGEGESLSKRFGFVRQIRITGWAANAVVRDELCAARLMVLPSFAEGLPVVIMEALALGRPVLTTYVAGVPELVSAECGWLVPAGSVDALVEMLQRALDTTDEQMAKLGAEGRRRAIDQHDARKEAAKLMRLFERYATVVKD
jgi:glycosyltransferase involved in cell wall biosynthesis